MAGFLQKGQPITYIYKMLAHQNSIILHSPKKQMVFTMDHVAALLAPKAEKASYFEEEF